MLQVIKGYRIYHQVYYLKQDSFVFENSEQYNVDADFLEKFVKESDLLYVKSEDKRGNIVITSFSSDGLMKIKRTFIPIILDRNC
jgi:hypothetical protein